MACQFEELRFVYRPKLRVNPISDKGKEPLQPPLRVKKIVPLSERSDPDGKKTEKRRKKLVRPEEKTENRRKRDGNKRKEMEKRRETDGKETEKRLTVARGVANVKKQHKPRGSDGDD